MDTDNIIYIYIIYYIILYNPNATDNNAQTIPRSHSLLLINSWVVVANEIVRLRQCHSKCGKIWTIGRRSPPAAVQQLAHTIGCSLGAGHSLACAYPFDNF